MKKIKIFIPIILFFIILFFLWSGLKINPHNIPSPLIGKKVPSEKNIDPKIFLGHISILNIFATWCVSCATEQPVLIDLHQQYPDLNIIGLSYKDNPAKIATWLKKYNNPYNIIINDPDGNIGIDLGVYGTPETFIIDQQGIIRDKIVGPVSIPAISTRLKRL